MKVFRSNGLRFYPISNTNAPIGTRFLDLPYNEQNIFKQASYLCEHQPVKFNDVVKIQVKSNAQVVYQVYNASGTLLSSGNFTDEGAFDGEKVWWLSLNLAGIIGLNTGSWIRINNGTHYFRTQPLINEDRRLLKFTYSNYKDHADYGSYRACNEMVAYIPASLAEHILPTKKTVFTDSVGRYKKIVHEWQDGRLLRTRWLPFYLIQIVEAALNHDVLFIQENTGNYLVTSPYEVYNDAVPTIDRPNKDYQGYELSVPLVELDTFGRRLPAFEPQILAESLALLPETAISATSFTINWTPQDVDFYQVQVSTNPDFSSPFINATNVLTNSYTASGLTSCVKYYYRVRASLCGVFGAWSSNVTNQRQTVHFRGDFKAQVLNFDEKIYNLQVANLFSWAVGVEYRLSSGTVTDPYDAVWSLLPALTLTQLQSNIDSQTGSYTIHVSIQDYAVGISDAVLEFVYNTQFFWLRVGCTTYNFNNGISQDLWIGSTRKMQIDSITLTGGATVLGYELITSPLGVAVSYGTNLTALNTAIAGLLTNQPYVVGIYVSSSNTTITINNRYL